MRVFCECITFLCSVNALHVWVFGVWMKCMCACLLAVLLLQVHGIAAWLTLYLHTAIMPFNMLLPTSSPAPTHLIHLHASPHIIPPPPTHHPPPTPTSNPAHHTQVSCADTLPPTYQHHVAASCVMKWAWAKQWRSSPPCSPLYHQCMHVHSVR